MPTNISAQQNSKFIHQQVLAHTSAITHILNPKNI